MPSLMTIKEVAPILNVKPVTIYRLIKQREIPFRRVGHKILFSDSDLQQYLDSTKVEPIPAGGKNGNTNA